MVCSFNKLQCSVFVVSATTAATAQFHANKGREKIKKELLFIPIPFDTTQFPIRDMLANNLVRLELVAYFRRDKLTCLVYQLRQGSVSPEATAKMGPSERQI